LRRLLHQFIASLRERPFSYKIAYCRELTPSASCDLGRLQALFESTEYLMGRVAIADAIRRHRLGVSSVFLRRMAETANRYQIKGLLLILRARRSLRTLVRVAKHPLCENEPLVRHLLIQAAKTQGVDPNMLGVHFNTEETEFSEEEIKTWRLWRPLDDLILAINDASHVPADTLRLMLFDNREVLAEELAHDLSDVLNIAPDEIPFLTRRRLVSLLAKYVDLSYLVCQALAEGDFRPLEQRLAGEERIQPPGVLLPPEATHRLPQRQVSPPAPGEEPPSRGGVPDFGEVFPEEELLESDLSRDVVDLSLDEIPFQPEWAKWVPRMLAEELLIIPLHVLGDPPERITIGCGHGDHRAVEARLAGLGCEITITDLAETLVREAIQRFYE
jgi:hypothetical protein